MAYVEAHQRKKIKKLKIRVRTRITVFKTAIMITNFRMNITKKAIMLIKKEMKV